jgi:hypothetical protein
MCIIEENTTANGADVYIGMITICPSTGDVVWDEFEGTIRHIYIPLLTLFFGRHPDANGARGSIVFHSFQINLNDVDETSTHETH